jgi:hypothetical protein
LKLLYLKIANEIKKKQAYRRPWVNVILSFMIDPTSLMKNIRLCIIENNFKQTVHLKICINVARLISLLTYLVVAS